MRQFLALCLLLAWLASCETGGSALDRPALEQREERSGTFHPPTPPVYDRRGYTR